MYSVLIIDDEEPVREAIRILGDWNGLQVDHVWEAGDGNVALQLLKTQGADIAVVDMKMPELDGAEFLRIVEEQYPELLVIVVSGYDDYPYTRQAIRTGVIDYLLKPVNRIELNQALRKAVQQLEAKQKYNNESIARNITYNMSLPKLKEKTYQSLLDRSFHISQNKTLLSLIGADLPERCYGVAVFRFINLEEVKQRRFHSDAGLLYFAAANMVDELQASGIERFSFANPKRSREMITVFTKRDRDAAGLAFQMEWLVKQAHSAFRGMLDIKSAAGIGRVCQNITEIADSYASARRAIKEMNLRNNVCLTVCPAGNVQAAWVEVKSLLTRMPQMQGLLEGGNMNQARVILNEYIRQLREQDLFRLTDADRVLQEFWILLRDTAALMGLTGSAFSEKDPETAGFALDFDDFNSFEKLLHRLLDYYGELARQSQLVQAPFDAKDIKDYIDAHYYEDFKISLFTEKYFLSREYLMKRFKQQFGCGIHEYAQSVRMNKAKELLSDPALKIQEISEMLSYRDKNYFSKAFRNYFDMSPTEFRAGLFAKAAEQR